MSNNKAHFTFHHGNDVCYVTCFQREYQEFDLDIFERQLGV